MRAEVAAIRALLEPLAGEVFYVDAPSTVSPAGVVTVPAPPYHIVWSSAGDPPDEQSVLAERTDIDDLVGVTSVAGTPDGVLIIQAAARAALCPGGLPRRLDVTGRRAVLVLERSERIDVDTDVVASGLNRSPAYGVDLYRLRSTPA